MFTHLGASCLHAANYDDDHGDKEYAEEVDGSDDDDDDENNIDDGKWQWAPGLFHPAFVQLRFMI